MYRGLFFLIAFLIPSFTASNGQSATPPSGANVAPATPQAGDSSPATPARPENWNELSLSKSGLNTASYSAVVLGKGEEADYTRELVRVQWRRGDPIDIYVVLPHGVSKPPAILYLYDYRYGTERFRDNGWCGRATKGGFAAVGITSALSFERIRSPRPRKQWFVSELEEALGASTHDVQMILNYLASRGDIDMGRVGMFAQGSGGAVAVLAAAVDSRIAVLDLLDPWGDWPDWMKDSPQIPEDERGNYLQPEFLKKVAGLDPVKYIPQLPVRALRIQQVRTEPVTPASAKEKIAAATLPPEQTVWYEDAAAHAAAWRTEGLGGWIRQQLSPASK
jgi:hypothetical protein